MTKKNIYAQASHTHLVLMAIATLLPFVACAQDDMSESDYSEDAPNAPRQKAQGQNFFDKNKTDQNFFGGRNLSSNSIFSPQNGSMGNVIEAPQPQQDSFDASQQSVAVVEPPAQSEEPSSEVKTESEISQEQAQSIVRNAQGADPGIQDVIEHSKKIRQAIFGDEAEKTMPKIVREKLPSGNPAKKIDEMRF